MQGNLTEEIFKRLDSLAQTLGTTSQYLYSTLAKKGFALGILAVVTVLAFLISFIVMYRTWASFKYEEDKHYNVTDATVAHIVLGVATSIITLVLFIATITNAPDTIYLISPEAYATERVIELLR